MPAVGGPVIGNMGMSWHDSLPSFDSATKVAKNPTTAPLSSVKKPAAKPALQFKKQPEAGLLFIIIIFIVIYYYYKN